MNHKNKTINFIEKAKKVHGDKYDYSKVEYKTNKDKVCIICPEHGEFWQTPHNHLQNHGCPKCAGKNITTEEFIERAKAVHNNKYDYSLVEYVNSVTDVKIICPTHGVFEQKAGVHLQGHGCLKCGFESGREKNKFCTEEFIRKSKEIHGDKYDYSLVEYVNSATKVKIICPIHGVFEQRAEGHLGGYGCKQCYFDSKKNACLWNRCR